MIEDGKRVIPVMLDSDVMLPPLLRARGRIGIQQIDQIVDAIHGRTQKPPLAPSPALIRRQEFVLQLRRIDAGTLGITPSLDSSAERKEIESKITSGFAFSYADFLKAVSTTARSTDAAAYVGEREKQLYRLGEELGRVLLPGEIPEQITPLLKENAELTLVLETAEHRPAFHPFRGHPPGRWPLSGSPAGRVLSQTAKERPDAARTAPNPAPLRILVAIGAPDENLTRNSVLDLERELGTIIRTRLTKHALMATPTRVSSASAIPWKSIRRSTSRATTCFTSRATEDRARSSSRPKMASL